MKSPPLHSVVSRHKLEKLYVTDGLPTVVIAQRLSTNRESVRKLIHRYGLPMRSKGSGMAKKRQLGA